jgi:PAS domain S-box-containing protein
MPARKELKKTSKLQITSADILNSIEDFVFIVNKQGKLLSSNKLVSFAKTEEFLGQPLYDRIFPEHKDKVKKAVKTVFDTGKAMNIETKASLPGNKGSWLSCRISPVVINKTTRAALIVARDITLEKNIEERIFEMIACEHKRIGQELHDGLSQHLTGISFLAKVLEKKLITKGLGEENDMRKIVLLVNDAIDHTRGLARGLHLVDLQEGNLEDLMQELVQTTKKIYNIDCKLDFGPDVVIKELTVATHLYRIVQEAISNAIKHGKAKKIIVKAKKKKNKVELSIVDEGVGIDVSREPSGTGLKIMRYRADMIGANLEIKKGKQRGTVVSCSFCSQNKQGKL